MIFPVLPSAWHLEEAGSQSLHSSKDCAPLRPPPPIPRSGCRHSRNLYCDLQRWKIQNFVPLFLLKQSLESCFNTMSNLKPERFYFYNLPPGLQTALGEAFNYRKRFEILPKQRNRIFYYQVHFKVIFCVKEICRKCIAYHFCKNQLLQHLTALNFSLWNTVDWWG